MSDKIMVEAPGGRRVPLDAALLDIRERLDRIEATTTCVVAADTSGYVYRTGCDVDVHADWSAFTFCPKCGKRLVGHDKKGCE